MLSNGIKYCLTNDQKQKKFRENPSWNILETEADLVSTLIKKSSHG